jgi:diadenosine tetraphosphate (Ap4A) HIT family hydrolase
MPQARGVVFQLDPAFEATSDAVGDLALSHVRLQRDARYAWLVLIPRVVAVQELENLAAADRVRLLDDVVLAGAAVRAVGLALRRRVEKLNVGQLGNLTPQLHVHVVGRRGDDPAWPGPVWGHGTPEPWGPGLLSVALEAARRELRL